MHPNMKGSCELANYDDDITLHRDVDLRANSLYINAYDAFTRCAKPPDHMWRVMFVF
jgi:hypothetical protein